MSGVIGVSPNMKSGRLGKFPTGTVVQYKHGDWTNVNNYGWISSNHNDWSWSRRSTEMTFTNCTPGNKLVLWGAPSGYMGLNDKAVHWTWFIDDAANNEFNLAEGGTASGGMGGNGVMAAFYNHEGSEDFGQSNGVMATYEIQPTSGGTVECRMLLQASGTGSNLWLEQRSWSIGFEVAG